MVLVIERDIMLHDENYWKEAIELLSGSLKTCQPQNRGDYCRAIIYAERKLRRLRMAVMVCLMMCVMLLLSGCNTMEALNNDTRAAIRAVTEK